VFTECKSCVCAGRNSKGTVWRSAHCHYASWKWYWPGTHELREGGVQVQDGKWKLLIETYITSGNPLTELWLPVQSTLKIRVVCVRNFQTSCCHSECTHNIQLCHGGWHLMNLLGGVWFRSELACFLVEVSFVVLGIFCTLLYPGSHGRR